MRAIFIPASSVIWRIGGRRRHQGQLPICDRMRVKNWRAIVSSREYRYTVVFDPAEEGGYAVTCPALPGRVTEGETLAEARAMAVEAMQGYLEALAKDGLPIPSGEAKARRKVIRETVAVAIGEA